MLIGVVSDTHIPRRRKELPLEVMDGLKGVDLILHAGDINKDYVLYELEEIAPVHVVAGNTDDEYILNFVGRKKVISAEDCRIGLIHGDGSSGTTHARAMAAFARDRVDCVVFGHSHIPMNEIINGVLFFNPGSPTDKRLQERYSYGILRVEGNKVQGEIKYF